MFSLSFSLQPLLFQPLFYLLTPAFLFNLLTTEEMMDLLKKYSCKFLKIIV